MSFLDMVTFQQLSGPTFLVFYFFGAGAIVAFGINSWLQRLSYVTTGKTSQIPLTAYHYAYLAGGQRQAVLAALVRLEADGLIRVDKSGSTPRLQLVEGVSRDPLESALLQRLDRPTPLDTLLQSQVLVPQMARLAFELGEHDLVVPRDLHARAVYPVAGVAIGYLSIGLLRLILGISLHRPVGFLLLGLLLMTRILFNLCRYRLANERGHRLLKDRKQQCAALDSASRGAGSKLAGSDLALAMALFGSSALASSLLPVSSGGSGCGSSGCGGGGCGGGCGGCGG
ncbi:MAG: TIGR04222 domain-containing membrane protein [Vulcanimicrobiota bacterium]